LEYLKKDQFDSGLWGKSIKQLFLKCFNRKKVPDEYRGIGSFSATDIVLRDLLVPNGATQLWKKDELLKTIRKQRDSFGGVGLNERIDINKFSIGQLKIDSNIRHTSAVVNISLLLEKHVDAMLSLNWLYQVENHWVDSNDGKMPINIACLIDCIDHARRNPGFANHCYCNPVEFRYIKEGFMCWEKKRNDLYRILNSSLLGERLWALRDSKGNLIENTMIYITLFILLRLENYPSLFPKKFTQIVWALYKLRTGHGLPFSLGSRKTIDVGATGTFLKIVFGEKAQEVLRSELTVNEFAELSDWLSASHKALFEKYLTRDSLTKSFAEIVSPILFLMRQ
ncbi:MAG: hypothetical protein KJ625_08575, partial [Actinobacteria bacterium]|nr:hypothetical protein [Actinomycetota bacterium]